jgi:hypothetical protein
MAKTGEKCPQGGIWHPVGKRTERLAHMGFSPAATITIRYNSRVRPLLRPMEYGDTIMHCSMVVVSGEVSAAVRSSEDLFKHSDYEGRIDGALSL